MKGNRFTRPVSIVLVLVLIVVLAAFAISCGQEQKAGEKIGIVVTILPLADFVENVGGEEVDITVMVPPGASPHTYELTPSQMVAVSKAKIYAKVGSGVEFELAWMDKIIEQNRNMLVVDCSRGIELIEMDPHIWLSPLNAKIMVENICAGLTKVDPDNQSYYTQNKNRYLAKLDALDKAIRESLSEAKNRRFIVFHPSWGYFARDYNLEQVPIEVGGKEPSAEDIAHLIEEALEHDIKIVFASPQFSVKSAEVIAKEIGGKVAFINPLARDYINNLSMVLDEMPQAME